MRRLLDRWRRHLRGAPVRNVAGRGASRRALLLYVARAFRPGWEHLAHQNVMQQRELAAAIGERGFVVDVADYDETRPHLLASRYDLVVDLHPAASPVYAGRLSQGAVRIAYLTGSNTAFTNAAETARLEALAGRRGIRLGARRANSPFPRTLERYDAIFLIGNAVTLATYAEFRLPPVHLIFVMSRRRDAAHRGYHGVLVDVQPGTARIKHLHGISSPRREESPGYSLPPAGRWP